MFKIVKKFFGHIKHPWYIGNVDYYKFQDLYHDSKITTGKNTSEKDVYE